MKVLVYLEVERAVIIYVNHSKNILMEIDKKIERDVERFWTIENRTLENIKIKGREIDLRQQIIQIDYQENNW